MNKSSDKFSKIDTDNFNRISRPLIISTIIIVLIIVILGILNYFHTQANLSKNAFLNLENISNSKVSGVNYWRKDKIDDAKLLMNDVSHRELLINFEKGISSEQQVLDWMKSLLIHEDIIEFILFDTLKTPLIYTKDKEYIVEKERVEAFNACIKTKNVVMSDFFVENRGAGVRIALFVPVFKSSRNKNEISKLLMLDIDPKISLYNFISAWPVPSMSSEVLLIRDNGNDVVYLTNVKGTDKTALNFRISKSDSSIISVKAANGLRGNYRGLDYTKKDVHSFINDVPGTNWILITKTNSDEIRQSTILTSVYVYLITFVLVMLALFIVQIYNKRNKEYFFKGLYRNELQKNIHLQRFNILLNSANDCIKLYDENGNIVDANRKALDTYGYTLEEIKKLNVIDIRAAKSKSNIKEIIKALKSGEGMTFETLHQTKSGKIFPVEVSASRIDFDGKTYLQGISRDISSRKEFENKLIESEEKFKSVFTYANDVMLILDGMNIVEANHNAEILFGYTREQLINMTPEDISPEFQEGGKSSKIKSKNYVDKALNGEPQFFEWIHKTSSGTEFPTEVSLNSITINNKIFIFVVLRDITFRKIIDLTLKDKEKSLELALNGAELGYYDMNLTTGVVTTNQNCYRMLGYEEEDVTQSRSWWKNLIHIDDIEKSNQIWEEHLSGKSDMYQMEVRMRNKDGSYKWILDKSKIFEVSPDGSAVRIVGTHMDISKRKSYEDAILKAKKAAEDSNNLKSNFLMNMSHELRTPLTGILGFSELLLNELENDDHKEMVDLILKGGNRLTATLNSILDLSRLESNQLDIVRDKMNIVGIAEEVVANLKIAAENKNLNLSFESKYQIVNCLIDEKMLTDICYNLIQNAITYTDKGEIRVKIDTVTKNGKDYASISVKDTGIGIAQKFHKQIFEPFRQASEGLSRKFEGTGLGLTLTKKYVDMLDGNIKLISEEGCGSEFIVTLPLMQAVLKPVFNNQNIVNIKKNNKLTSLFVEDEIESYELVRMLLRPYMEVDNITSGKVAMEQVQNKQYNMIFMDIGLSDTNGMDVIRFIRKLDNYKYIPVIAVTAFAMEGDKERILESGCNEYISKPFTKEDLISAVGKYINIKNNN